MVKANELYPNYSGWKFNLRKVNIKSLTIKRIEYEKDRKTMVRLLTVM